MITPKGGRPFPQFYTPKKTVDWERHVADVARIQVLQAEVQGVGNTDFTLPLEGRILTTIRFNMAKPKSYPKSVIHHTKKPDRDNLEKAVLDGLVLGGIIKDDALVTDGYSFKRYVEPGHPEGVEIDLTCLPTELP